MTDSPNPIDVDDVDQGPPIMRVVANADGTVSLTMAPADAAALAGVINDHIDRVAFGQSLHRIVHGSQATDVGSLRWTQLVTDLLAARAELEDRVDVRFYADFTALLDLQISRPIIDVDITAATTLPLRIAVNGRELVACPGQCGRRIREGRLLCTACFARVPQPLVRTLQTRRREGHAGGWEDQHIRNHEDAKRAVLDAALGDPVDADPQEPQR